MPGEAAEAHFLCTSGRTSTAPIRAAGTRAAISIASSSPRPQKQPAGERRVEGSKRAGLRLALLDPNRGGNLGRREALRWARHAPVSLIAGRRRRSGQLRCLSRSFFSLQLRIEPLEKTRSTLAEMHFRAAVHDVPQRTACVRRTRWAFSEPPLQAIQRARWGFPTATVLCDGDVGRCRACGVIREPGASATRV
jgi:hypothetical protein